MRIAVPSLAVVASVACATCALAGPVSLDFQLVTRTVDAKALDSRSIPGLSIGVMRATGAATFPDGRIATKEFVYGWDFNKGAGPFYGYSTYTFADGSSITARFAGTMEAGKPMHGEYTVLSGTGAYAGATGGGHFDLKPAKYGESNYYLGRFNLVLP